MNNPPQHVVVDLEGKDIHEDLLDVVYSMGAVRNEQLANREITDEKRNEYLHLVYRLASCIESLSDEGLVSKMQETVQSTEDNGALLFYDFLQDDFWRELESNFTRKLDHVTIQLMGDDFRGLEDKHQIFNALKYIGSKDLGFKERLPIYDSIMPHNSPLTELNKTRFARNLKKSASSEKIRLDGSTLFVGERPRNLERILETAGHFGFSHLRCVVNGPDEVKELIKKYNAEVKDQNYKEVSKSSKSKTVRFFSNAVKKTKPLSYPILGMLPASIQRRIENKFDESGVDNAFDPRYASIANMMLEDLSFSFGGIVASTPAIPEMPWWTFIPSITYLIASNPRKRLHKYGWPTGDIATKVVLAPLEIGLNHFCGKVYVHPVLVEMGLKKNKQNGSPETRVHHNYHPLMEKLAERVLKPEKEQNLVWSLDNYHTQGKYFEKALKSEGINFKGFGKERHLARKTGALTLYDVLDSEPYKKISALVCFQQRRYALTYVGNNNVTLTDFPGIGDILSQDKSIEEQLKTIANHTNADYIHLSSFDKGQKTGDLTGSGG